MTFLYIIAPSANGPCKVGFARDVRKRLISIQIGCFLDLEVHSTWQHPLLGARACEALIHAQLMRDHMRGEWFAVSVSQVEAIATSIGMHREVLAPAMDADAIQRALALGRKPNILVWPI